MEELLRLASPYKDEIAAIAGVCALLVAFVSVIFTVMTLWIQRRHNVLSVRPLGQLMLADYGHDLYVKLLNHGVGPLLVHSIDIYGENGKFLGHDLVRILPPPPGNLAWSDYTMYFEGMAVAVQGSLVLMQFKGNSADPEFVSHLGQIRKALSLLRIEIRYRDIYGNRLPRIGGPAAWFAPQDARAAT